MVDRCSRSCLNDQKLNQTHSPQKCIHELATTLVEVGDVPVALSCVFYCWGRFDAKQKFGKCFEYKMHSKNCHITM